MPLLAIVSPNSSSLDKGDDPSISGFQGALGWPSREVRRVATPGVASERGRMTEAAPDSPAELSPVRGRRARSVLVSEFSNEKCTYEAQPTPPAKLSCAVLPG